MQDVAFPYCYLFEIPIMTKIKNYGNYKKTNQVTLSNEGCSSEEYNQSSSRRETKI